MNKRKQSVATLRRRRQLLKNEEKKTLNHFWEVEEWREKKKRIGDLLTEQ